MFLLSSGGKPKFLCTILRGLLDRPQLAVLFEIEKPNISIASAECSI